MDLFKKKSKINILHKLEHRSIGICKRNQSSSFYDLSDSLKSQLHPHLQASWTQRPIQIGDKNKIFASQWLNNEEVLYGTKCNQLVHLNLDTGRECAIPLLNSINSMDSSTSSIHSSDFPDNCSPSSSLLDHSSQPIIFGSAPTTHTAGIHTIQSNPNATRLATGAANVNDIGVYSLPELDPVCVLENGHSNWLFDLRWMDDSSIASCSRDNRVALWNLERDSDRSFSDDCGRHFSLDPAFVLETPNLRDKVRSMEYIAPRKLLAVLSTNQILYFYDPVTMSNINSKPHTVLQLPNEFYDTMVVRAWPSQPFCLAISGQQRLAIYDCRSKGSQSQDFIHIFKCHIDNISGIRSLNFNGPVISYGTSNGFIFFFDMRNQRHILALKSPTMPSPNYSEWNPYFGLHLPETWLPTNVDHDYRIGSRASAKISAVYTHEYDRFGTRLFCAGGPITAQVYGNVACVYE